MTWNKLVILFFMFGCWFKYFGNTIGFIGYNIWYCVVLFWIVLNGLGCLNFFLHPFPMIKTAKSVITKDVESKWVASNAIAATSFFMCHEYIVGVAFLLTSVLFMLLMLHAKKGSKRK